MEVVMASWHGGWRKSSRGASSEHLAIAGVDMLMGRIQRAGNDARF